MRPIRLVLTALFALVAAGALGGRPAGAAGPAATVAPAANLRNQQTVHVTASGFPPSTVLHMLQCRPDPQSYVDCSGFTDDTSGVTDRRGTVAVDVSVYTLPNPIEPTADPISCGPRAPCVLLVTVDYLDFTKPKAIAGTLTFDPKAPPATGTPGKAAPTIPPTVAPPPPVKRDPQPSVVPHAPPSSITPSSTTPSTAAPSGPGPSPPPSVLPSTTATTTPIGEQVQAAAASPSSHRASRLGLVFGGALVTVVFAAIAYVLWARRRPPT